MALRIVFETGPDKGREFLIVGENETRIGRGPGFHIVPRDQDWKGGLRVEMSKGVYQLTNEMASPILRDGDTPLPQNKTVILYHGTTIQPTAETLLRCSIVDDPADRVEGVTETTAKAKGLTGAKLMQLVIIIVCLPVAAVLFLMPSSEDTTSRSPGEVRREYRAARDALAELRKEPGAEHLADSLDAKLREGRGHEIRKAPEEAYACYLEIREELDRQRRNPTSPLHTGPVARKVRDYVNQRILELNARHKVKQVRK